MAEQKKLNQPETSPEKKKTKEQPQALPDWRSYIKSAAHHEISLRFSGEIDTIISKYPELEKEYSLLFLLNPTGRIGAFDLDQIFRLLPVLNPEREKAILLTILSNGGAIESAYQISKLCKSFTKKKFVITIPRQAKSAATLLALGADEIHMGNLSQLGPIDPQLGNLPALGVSQALRTLATLAQEFPGSSEMFARYLRMAVTVEQIGYCERISESAVQYATRLIETKPAMIGKAQKIAYELVYEYKHHGFVIDSDEAKKHLGQGWRICNSKEIEFAEEIYRMYDFVNLYLDIYNSKYLWWVGSSKESILVMDSPKNG